ncbi:hypothetical protein [Cerasicoccus frondis]|uniref:hypothetical protein n=1 Tax=Cerasicoccus frondis TaxID=490090 RepID=UPI0028525243|nr:hypothetical protein [Cerasicoccus frondis]
MGRKQINVTVEDDLKREFEAVCDSVDMPAGMLLRHAARAIIEFYNEHGYISSPLKVVPSGKADSGFSPQREPEDSPYSPKAKKKAAVRKAQ